MADKNPLVDDLNWRVVQLLADGHRRRDVASMVALSLSAVNRRLDKLRAQAGARNTTHLVALALRRGWIE